MHDISAEKDLTVMTDLKNENGLMILYHCRNSEETSVCIEGCVRLY